MLIQQLELRIQFFFSSLFDAKIICIVNKNIVNNFKVLLAAIAVTDYEW